MRKFAANLIAALLIGLVLAGCVSPIQPREGNTVYTQRNLWFEHGEHKTTNYHVRYKVPVNTKVTIKDTNSDSIRFKVADTGNIYRIVNIAKYSRQDIEGIYERYFASRPVELDAFSQRGRDAIDDGVIRQGITKEALLVARGYPPAHETRSTDKDRWRYWRTRFDTRIVKFENNRVESIKD